MVQKSTKTKKNNKDKKKKYEVPKDDISYVEEENIMEINFCDEKDIKGKILKSFEMS